MMASDGGMMGNATGMMGSAAGAGGGPSMPDESIEARMTPGAPWGAPVAHLTPSAKGALLRALDEEYRAEALYAHVASELGAKPPLETMAQYQHRHAWVLESLALAHGLELPANRWTSTKQPTFANVAAACQAGAESETKTISTYDQLLKGDLPPDLRQAFTNLRAASERLRPAFEQCR